MLDKYKQLLVSLAMRTNQEISNRKCDTELVSRCVATQIGIYIGKEILDVPTADDVIIGQYYRTNHQPLVDEIVSHVNEKMIIDYKRASDIAYKTLLTRYSMASGKYPMKQFMKGLEELDMHFSKEDTDAIDCLLDD